MPVPRIYADFQNADPLGRVRLNCAGTIRDLADQGVQLLEDIQIEIYSEDLATPAEVQYSREEGVWVALIDWSRLLPQTEASLDPVATNS